MHVVSPTRGKAIAKEKFLFDVSPNDLTLCHSHWSFVIFREKTAFIATFLCKSKHVPSKSKHRL